MILAEVVAMENATAVKMANVDVIAIKNHSMLRSG
jgi:hypothetical protein